MTNSKKYEVSQPLAVPSTMYRPIMGWQLCCTSYWYFVLFISVLSCLVMASLVMFWLCGREVGGENCDINKFDKNKIYEENNKIIVSEENCDLERKIKNNSTVCDIAFLLIIIMSLLIILFMIFMSIIKWSWFMVKTACDVFRCENLKYFWSIWFMGMKFFVKSVRR